MTEQPTNIDNNLRGINYSNNLLKITSENLKNSEVIKKLYLINVDDIFTLEAKKANSSATIIELNKGLFNNIEYDCKALKYVFKDYQKYIKTNNNLYINYEEEYKGYWKLSKCGIYANLPDIFNPFDVKE